VPIPGARHAARLEQNVATVNIDLDDDALQRLQPLSDLVVGALRRHRHPLSPTPRWSILHIAAGHGVTFGAGGHALSLDP